VVTRFYRWTKLGLWERLLAELRRIADAAGEIDWRRTWSTVPACGRTAAPPEVKGVRKQALGRSRGGFGSKPHLRCDRQGRLTALVLTPGERNEKAVLPELMRPGAVKRAGPGRPRLRPRAVVGDRGYSGRPTRDDLRRRGISPVIPQLRTEKMPRLMDWALYRERNVVARLVGKLKEYRRIATRYEKLARATSPSSSSPRPGCGFERKPRDWERATRLKLPGAGPENRAARGNRLPQ
jgi:transposase